MDIYSNEDEHLLQLISKNTWSVCLNCGDFFSHVYHVISRGSPKPSQEESKKTPTKLILFPQLRTSWDKTHVTFSPNTCTKIPFFFPQKQQVSGRHYSLPAFLHPLLSPLGAVQTSLAVPSPPGLRDSRRVWQCTWPHVWQAQLSDGEQILCSGSIFVLDFQGLGSLWRGAIFLSFVFGFFSVCFCFSNLSVFV